MPDQDRVTQPEDALSGLLTERDALHRRLAWVDAQVTHHQLARQDAMLRRLASLEQAVRQMAPTTSWAAPPVEARVADAPVAPAEDRPRPASPATPHEAAAVSPVLPGSRPPVGVDLTAGAPITVYTSSAKEAPAAGWIPRGSRFRVVGNAAGWRTPVVYQGASVWVDTAALNAGQAPSAAAPTAAPAVALAGTAAVVARAAATPVGSTAGHPPASPALPPRPPVPPQAAPPPPRWSRQGFMSRLLALVGAGVTLIGVAFLLILAAQYGMFGPLARTLSAATLAVVLVGLAFLVRARDPKNVGAPILAATGVAAGYLSVVTATVIYAWLPPILGVVLAALIGLGGMVLARMWSNEWVAIISVLGSLVLAAYIGSAELVITAGLMLVMTGVTLWFERGTGWRLFPFARVVPTVLVLLGLALGFTRLSPDQLRWVVVLAVGLALLGLLSAVIAPAEPPAGQLIALGLLAPMAAPAALAPQFLPDSAAAAVVLGVVAVAFVVSGFLPKVHERVRWAAVPLGAAFVMLAAFAATQHRYLGVLTLALAVGYLAVAAKARSGVNLIVGGVLAALGIMGWLPLLFLCLDQHFAASAGPEQIGQSVAGIAVVVLGTMAATRWFGHRPRWGTYLSWSMAIAMGSAAVIYTGSWIGALSGDAATGFQASHAIVTIAWMVLCIFFLQRGLAARADEDVWLHLALAVAAFAVAKLFLLDLGMLAAIARVGAFLVVGLLLLFVGTRYARAWERAHGDDGDPEGVLAPPATAPAPGEQPTNTTPEV